MGAADFHCGTWGKVSLAVPANGECLARDFIEGLLQADRIKLIALLRRAANVGPMDINNREKFKKLEDDFYEFKSFQIRMPCFYDRRSIVLTHGFKKKKDEIAPSELARARRIRDESRAALPSLKQTATANSKPLLGRKKY